AEMCIMELVDYNELYTTGAKKAAGKTRRKRGGKKADATDVTEVAAPAKKKAKASDADGSASEASNTSDNDDIKAE
ncbi:MAG: 50S ribosomal protein L17, partial [Bacteroidia bacterium]